MARLEKLRARGFQVGEGMFNYPSPLHDVATILSTPPFVLNPKPWWRPSTICMKLADVGKRGERAVRRIIYENLGAFRMDLIDAMVRAEIPEPFYWDDPRQQWLRRSKLEDMAVNATVWCFRVENRVADLYEKIRGGG